MYLLYYTSRKMQEEKTEEQANTTSSLSEPCIEKLQANLEIAKQQIQQRDNEIARLVRVALS